METRHEPTDGFDFAGWLRTGRLIRYDARWGAREVKFNPNHDPQNGRFTFREGGTASGGRTSTARTREASRGTDARDAGNHDVHTVKPGDTLTHLAATRSGLKGSDLAELNGLSTNAKLQVGQRLIVPTQEYLDSGKEAFDRTVALDAYIQSHGGKLPPDVAHPPSLAQQTYGPGTRQVTVNGYTFTLDPQGRTREVTGSLASNPDQKRSRQAQASAGGSDRLPSDDGGHYIARQFNGPTEAFNHFAQDASSNRSDYRKMENDWARTLKKGEKVHVTISSDSIAGSKRPDMIYVSFTTGGNTKKRSFPNHAVKGVR